jgi:hypothetical protein
MSDHSIEKNPALGNQDLSGPALRTFFNIADAWDLNEPEQMRLLGLESRSTLQSWKRGQVRKIGRDALERISYVIGIFGALQILLPNEAEADKWIRKSNKAPLFSGRSAIERMASGNVADLFLVRQYLDGQRGWS